MKRFQPSPWHAMAISMTALFVALGGAGYAALSLPKNSVGTNQIQNGAVITAKLKNGAVSKNKLNVTGVTVPNALRARSATSAHRLAAPEPFHLVGAPGEPKFENAWSNTGGPTDEPAGFYKDQVGIVHLQGQIVQPVAPAGTVIFRLPPGYRPDRGKILRVPISACDCSNGQQEITTGSVAIWGPGVSANTNGAVTLDASTAVPAGMQSHSTGSASAPHPDIGARAGFQPKHEATQTAWPRARMQLVALGILAVVMLASVRC
jgi:hypothetical protein